MNDKIKDAHAFTMAIWQFYKTHANVRKDDEYWAAVVEDATKLDEQYGCKPVIRNIILAVINVLEEEERKL